MHSTLLRRSRALALVAALLTAGACSSDAATPTVTDAPPTTDAPATTPAPVASDAAQITDAPAATEPAPTEVPAATDAPATEPTRPLTVDELLTLGRPIVLAHAAGEDQHPHSTLFGYGESVRAGVDMLDLDVQLTGDGVLVVQHDDTVERTTDGTGNVADLTYAELATFDNAYWFTADCVCRDQPDDAYLYRGIRTGDRPAPDGYTPDDFAIPRFEDVLDRFPLLPVNIEIKGTGEPAIAAAEELARILAAHDLLDSAVVSSFDDAVVAAFSAAAPGVEVSPGLGTASAWVLDRTPLPDGMRILQLPPVYGDIEVLSAEVIADSHAAGYVIWVWPNDRELENAASYREFLDEGMDGLNANFPATAVDVVREFAG